MVGGGGDEYVWIGLGQCRELLDGVDGLMCQMVGAGGDEYVWIYLDQCR